MVKNKNTKCVKIRLFNFILHIKAIHTHIKSAEKHPEI